MITAAIRRGLLANFPPGTPLDIVAPDGAFDELVTARNDPSTTLHADAGTVPAASTHVIVEGIDWVEDPVALFVQLRAAAPRARLFALACNAAYLPALTAYFTGAGTSTTRPLVRADVERVLAAAGWQIIGLEPIAGEAAFAAPEIPGNVTLGPLTFRLADAAMLERMQPAAFLAVADPA
jgi:hypothetical protein